MTFGTMEIWKRNILITGVVVFLIYMLHFLKTYQECRRLAQRIPGQKPKNDLDDASSRIARKYHVTIMSQKNVVLLRRGSGVRPL